MSYYIASCQMVSDLSEGSDNVSIMTFIHFYQIFIQEQLTVFLSYSFSSYRVSEEMKKLEMSFFLRSVLRQEFTGVL